MASFTFRELAESSGFEAAEFAVFLNLGTHWDPDEVLSDQDVTEFRKAIANEANQI